MFKGQHVRHKLYTNGNLKQQSVSSVLFENLAHANVLVFARPIIIYVAEILIFLAETKKKKLENNALAPICFFVFFFSVLFCRINR